MLAVGKRKLRRVEDRRVEQVQRLVGERVRVPVEDPGVEKWIAEVRDGGAEVCRERPGEGDGDEKVAREKRNLADERAASGERRARGLLLAVRCSPLAHDRRIGRILR